MCTLLCLLKLIFGAAYHHIVAVVHKRLDDLLKIERLRAAINQRHIVDAE